MIKIVQYPVVYQLMAQYVHNQPKLFVELSIGTRRTGPFLAVVDSGADRSVFSEDIARQLNVDLSRDCTEKSVGTIAGKNIVHRCRLNVHLQGRDFEAEVNFLRNRRNVALLGRADVFDQFGFGFEPQQVLLVRV